MNDREKETVEELKKQLRLAINIDDVTTMIRNDDAEAILNLIEKLQKENEELRAKWDKDTHILQNKLDYANADRIDLTQQNKELRKENEELKFEERSRIIGKYGDAEIHDVINRTLSNDYIPVQKIKDIINRIDYDIKKTKEIISKNTNIYASYRKNDYQIVRLKAMNTKSLDIKKRLQELLDGSDTDVGSIESEE